MRTRLYNFAWAAFLILFVFVGLREVINAVREGEILPAHPSASTDAYLGALLDIPDASAHWSRILQQLPRERSIVLLCPKEQGRWAFVYGVMTYLSWPTAIHKIEVNDESLPEILSSVDRTRTAAVVFCALKPPTGYTRGWPLGAEVLVVPLFEQR